VGLYVADAVDHGISSALITGLLRIAVNAPRSQQADAAGGTLYADLTQPDMVLRVINRMLTKEKPSDESITMTYAVINLPDNTIALANAGHPMPFHYQSATRRHELLRAHKGASLGLLEEPAFTPLTTKLAENDRIVFYTEGLLSAAGVTGEPFGEKRLQQVLDENGDKSPMELIEIITRAVQTHCGKRSPARDYTVMVVQIR
jgi:sigma-B regulation protein RsbU (phosphoserine phosphatase)